MSHLIIANYELSYYLLVKYESSVLAMLDFDAAKVADNYLKADLFGRVI
jgi:hypothetical protein